MSQEFAVHINSDVRLDSVDMRAEMLSRTGAHCRNGYAEVWIRDLNTFITLVSHVADHARFYCRAPGCLAFYAVAG